MSTFVETQKDFTKALQALIQFEYAVIEAYDAAISKLRRHLYKEKLTDFKENHERHIRLVGDLLEEHGQPVPEGPMAATKWLEEAKSTFHTLAGDKNILKAVKTNEEVAARVYESMNSHAAKWEDADPIIGWSLEDEYNQQAWLKNILKE